MRWTASGEVTRVRYCVDWHSNFVLFSIVFLLTSAHKESATKFDWFYHRFSFECATQFACLFHAIENWIICVLSSRIRSSSFCWLNLNFLCWKLHHDECVLWLWVRRDSFQFRSHASRPISSRFDDCGLQIGTSLANEVEIKVSEERRVDDDSNSETNGNFDFVRLNWWNPWIFRFFFSDLFVSVRSLVSATSRQLMLFQMLFGKTFGLCFASFLCDERIKDTIRWKCARVLTPSNVNETKNVDRCMTRKK